MPPELALVLVTPNQLAHLFARRAVTLGLDQRVNIRFKVVGQGNVYGAHAC